MKELWILVKKDLLTDYPVLSNFSAALQDKKMRKKALLQPLVWVILGAYFWFFSRPILNLYHSYKALGAPEAFLAMGFLGFVMVLIFFTIPYILSKIYFSRDVETMLSLPIRKDNILLSKLVAISFSTLFFALVTAVPFMIKYGIEEKSGIFYYLYGFVGILLVALSIISTMSFLIILLMRWVGRLPRAKNILQFLGLLLVMVLSLGINVVIQSSINYENPGATLDSIAQGSKELIHRILPAFPQVKWLISAMEKSVSLEGLMYFGLSLVFALAITFVLIRLASPLMLKGVLENKAVGESKKANKRKGKNKSQAIWLSIAQKELSDLFKTPLYAINTLSGGIIMPVLMVLPGLLRSGVSIRNVIDAAQGFWNFLPFEPFHFFLAGIALGLIFGLFLGSIGSPNSTSFSREGKTIWLTRTLPISGKEQLKARLASGILMQIMLLLPTFLLILVFKPPIHLYLGIVLGGLFSGIFVSMVGLMIDVIRPKLNWDNPQEAMKQNINVFFSMAVNWGYLALVGVFLYRLKDSLMQGEILLPALVILATQLIIPGILAFLFIKNYNKLILNMD